MVFVRHVKKCSTRSSGQALSIQKYTPSDAHEHFPRNKSSIEDDTQVAAPTEHHQSLAPLKPVENPCVTNQENLIAGLQPRDETEKYL